MQYPDIKSGCIKNPSAYNTKLIEKQMVVLVYCVCFCCCFRLAEENIYANKTFFKYADIYKTKVHLHSILVPPSVFSCLNLL